MAPTKTASDRILAALFARDWSPPGGGPHFDHPPGWHRYLSPGSIAAIVLGVFFFLLLVGCIAMTYSSRFNGRRRRSRSSRGSRSYYTDTTSYATRTGTAGVRGGGSDEQAYYYYYPQYTTATTAAGGGAGGGVTVGVSAHQKRMTTRAKSAPSVTSASSPSSASSESSASSLSTRARAASSVHSHNRSEDMASDAATLAAGNEKKFQATVESVSSPDSYPQKMRKAKVNKRNGRRR